eukprot:TRINITY_DN2140_c0_g1_i1.p1 TRINITY_DN2140_c0_g1~~TRINITY_DN2140_c0_g1_i1.p1  ORF type:complete len:151 (+),score=31.80 TRINITY_DN2140_c0_g1_i1:56-508(+)
MEAIVANVLTQVALKNDEQEELGREPSYYDAAAVPQIAVVDLIKRWVKYSKGPKEAVVLAAILINRAIEGGLVIRSLSVHRVLLSALVVSTKFQADQVYSNSYYAKIGGVSHPELNRLEATFLTNVDWAVFVSGEEYTQTVSALKKMKQN